MQTFTRTSDLPYDRHKYRLFLSNGRNELFDDYESLLRRWMELPSQFLSHVEVIDRKKRKQ